MTSVTYQYGERIEEKVSLPQELKRTVAQECYVDVITCITRTIR